MSYCFFQLHRSLIKLSFLAVRPAILPTKREPAKPQRCRFSRFRGCKPEPTTVVLKVRLDLHLSRLSCSPIGAGIISKRLRTHPFFFLFIATLLVPSGVKRAGTDLAPTRRASHARPVSTSCKNLQAGMVACLTAPTKEMMQGRALHVPANRNGTNRREFAHSVCDNRLYTE